MTTKIRLDKIKIYEGKKILDAFYVPCPHVDVGFENNSLEFRSLQIQLGPHHHLHCK